MSLLRRSALMSAFTCTVAIVLLVALGGCTTSQTGLTGGGTAPATTVKPTPGQSSSPAQSSTSTPGPVASSPVQTLRTFFAAVQSGDFTTVSALAGTTSAEEGAGIVAWGSLDLTSFVGHTTFSNMSYNLIALNGSTARVRVTGSMTFKDPGGGAVTNYTINGEAKLVAGNGSWGVVGLPTYTATNN